MTDLADNALTTLSVVNGQIGYADGADTDRDDRIKRYINEASQLFADMTGRGWHYEEDHVERVAARGGHTLQVHERLPLASITSIVFDDRGGNTTAIDSDSYAIEDAKTGAILRVRGRWQNYTPASLYGPDHAPNDRRRHWKVTYTGGRITPKQEDDGVGTQTLPQDIEAAITAYAVMRQKSAGRDPLVKTRKIFDASITYVTGPGGSQILVPESFAALVNIHRRPW